MTDSSSIILVSELVDTEPLIDGRVRQTYRVIGYPGLVVRWIGREDGGRLESDSQFYETADGRRFDQAGAALEHWYALQPRRLVEEVAVAAAPPGDDTIRMRRFISRAAIPSRLKVLADVGISCEEVREGHYLVAGRLEYYPATGFWRSIADGAHGYTVETLIKQVLANGPATPNTPVEGWEAAAAASSDAAAAHQTSDERAGRECLDERTAGVTSGGGEQPRPSLRLLPRVAP